MQPNRSAGGSGPQQENLYGLERQDLTTLLAKFDVPAFHAAQVFHWLYGRQTTDVHAMTDLPAALRVALSERHQIAWPSVRETRRSSDGSIKYVLTLQDGAEIEAVYLLYGSRVTFCLSSQIGCPLDCRFCMTGTMGLVRNLTAGEILGQISVLARDNDVSPATVRIVFMGMGEPLNNYDAVMKAFRIMADPQGLAIPPRRVTLSTAGLVPGIERLAMEDPRPRLAVSLAASDDRTRSRLMPINRKYGLKELIEACRRFPLRPREHITFEYVLLAGVNDSVKDAERIARRIHGLRAKINVIPYNDAGVEGFSTPSAGRAGQFRDTLLRYGIPVTIRWSHGQDIGAACGQLVRGGTANRS